MSDNAAPTPAFTPATEDVNMPLPNATASHVLLLATINDLSTPCFLAPVIASATRCVRDRLLVVLFSRLFNTGRRPRSPLSAHHDKLGRKRSFDSVHSNNSSVGVSHTECWDDIQRLLTYVYVQATAVAQELDKVLLQADVLLRGFDEDFCEDFGNDFEVVIRIEGGEFKHFELNRSLLTLRVRLHSSPSSPVRNLPTDGMVQARGPRHGQRSCPGFSGCTRFGPVDIPRCRTRGNL